MALTSLGFVVNVHAGTVLVREPAEGVIRRRDRVAREARIAAAVSVRVITVRFLFQVRRALRGDDPGDEVRRVVGVALLYAVAVADAVAALRLADETAVLGVEVKLLYNFSLLWKQVRSHLPTLPQRFFSNFLPLPFPLQALHIHNL